jgi:nitrate reductase gamma subunit
MLGIQILTLICVLVAVIAMAAKALRYATAPEHMRWELYPVPHEKGRAEYGGSYLEELNWWTKPRHKDTLNELKEMAAEVLLLKGVYHHNRRVWISSLPFHGGLYLCIGWLLLLLTGAILQMAGIPVSSDSGSIGRLVHYVTIPVGYAGLVVSGLGAIGLLIWRSSSSDQRKFTSPIDYFNLLFFVVVSAWTVAAQAVSDPSFDLMRGYVGSTMSFSKAAELGAMLSVEIALISLLILWVPLTRMSHFVAKYFLYHSVRWNDMPNERGSKLEKRLLELLGKKVAWRGPHIQTGSAWGDVAKEMKNE